MSTKLPIVIAGVPPGVKVGVFLAEKERGDPERPLVLEEASSPEYFIERLIDGTYGGKLVRVVVRSAGFIPIAFETRIDPDRGLLRAVRLEVDRVYSGSKSEVPPNWDADAELNKAQQIILERSHK